jgi:hypothetical protein
VRIVFRAFRFATGDEAASVQRAELGGDDGEAIFDIAIVAKEDNPIACLAEFMGAGGGGEDRRVMTLLPGGVENGKPGFTFRIEAAGRWD